MVSQKLCKWLGRPLLLCMACAGCMQYAWLAQVACTPACDSHSPGPRDVCVPASAAVVCVCVCPMPHQLRQLFPDAQEWDSIQTLISAAQLLTGSSSSSNGSSGVREGAAESASDWPELYSHRHAGVILSVLSCWMPEALAAGFLRSHRVRGCGGGMEFGGQGAVDSGR